MLGRDARVVIVGGGIGGLAAATDLANAGYGVVVCEKDAVIGGKARAIPVGSTSVEWGPTVLTMRWVFDSLFEATGRGLSEYATLEPLEVLARHAWPDGSRLDLFADGARTFDAIASFAGVDEAKRYRAFSSYAGGIWKAAERPFVLSQKPSFLDIVKHAGTGGMGALLQIDALRTMWQSLEGAFLDPRLRQLFGRYATYSGGSPFESPATFNLVSHVESRGVYRVHGGMSALAKALRDRATDLGATIRCGTPVVEVLVSAGRARGVRLATGEELLADAVLVNADVGAISVGLLGDRAARAAPKVKSSDRSLSAFTIALVGQVEGEWPLGYHNVAFSSDYQAEWRELSGSGRLPSNLTVYACVQGGAAGQAPAHGERILLIANAPPNGDQPLTWTPEERIRCERAVYSSLEQCGQRVTPIASVTTTPVEFEAAFPATGGALYGPRPKGALSSLARSGARTRVPRLYLAGGSVHPGAGVPMAALSGRLAAACIREDLASTARSKPAATVGTISTG